MKKRITKINSRATLLGLLFFVILISVILPIKASQAALLNAYNKINGATLQAGEWNNLLSDFVSRNNGGDVLTGNYGINTATSSSYALDINGSLRATNFTGAFSGTINSANVSAGLFGSNTGGGNYQFPSSISVGIGSSTSPAVINIANNRWISALNSTGTAYVNMFKVNANDEIEVGSALNIGNFQFAADSGFNTFVDMPVTSASLNDSVQGYVMKIDGDNVLSVYSQSNGSGGIKNKRVGVNTSIPQYDLDVNGILNANSLYIAGQPFTGGKWSDNGSSIYYNLGYVGINTTSPQANLDVNGLIKMRNPTITANEDVINKGYLDSALASTTAGIITQVATSSFWQGSLTGNMYSANTGNVGIGTTNPTSKLDVNGDIYIESGSALYGNKLGSLKGELIAFNNTVQATRVNYGFYGTNAYNNLLNYGYQHIWYGTGDVERMRINNSGNVGIGTTNPLTKLEVNGKLQVNAVASLGFTGNSDINVYNSTGAKIQFYDNYNSVSLGSVKNTDTTNSDLVFNVGSGLPERMRINSIGNVGIGITNPTSKLFIQTSVSGSATPGSGDGIKLAHKDATGEYGWQIGTGDRNSLAFDKYYEGTWSRSVVFDRVTGDVGIGTTAPGTRLSVVGDGTYSIDAGNNRIGNVSAPVNATDAVNRSYLDSAIANATSSISTLWGGSVGGNVWSLNSGNVGIGTTSPSRLLHLYKDSADFGTGIKIDNPNNSAVDRSFIFDVVGNSGTGTNFGYSKANLARFIGGSDISALAFGTFGASDVVFGTNDTARMVIKATTGNVGIGTTTPVAALDVVGNNGTSSTGQQTLVLTNNIAWATPGSGPKIVFKRRDLGYDIAAVRSYVFGTGLTGLAFDTGHNALTTKMVIDNSGNVGIGTTNPTANLEVSRKAAIQGVDYSYRFTIDPDNGSGPQLQLGNSGDVSAYFKIGSWAGINAFDTKSRNFRIYSSSDYVGFNYVASSGNVGIGTTAPGTRLSVVGDGTYSIDAGNNRIGNVSAPVNATDAVNKSYVDSAAGGGIGSGINGQTLRHDGSTWVANSNLFNNGTNIGIGTTNPGAKLHINYGNTPVDAAETLRLDVVGNSASGRGPSLNFYSPNNSSGSRETASIEGVNPINGNSLLGGNLIFKVGDSSNILQERMIIDVAGNIGIGTASPEQKLSIESVSLPSIQLFETGGTNKWRWTATNNASYLSDASNGVKNIYLTAGGGAQIRSNGDLIAFSVENTAPANSMIIKSSTGNIGVGTTTVPEKLTISGGGLSLRTTGLSTKFILDTGWNASANDFFSIKNSSAANPQILLSLAGNVGIGTTNPGTRLSVVGDGTYSIDAGNNRIGNVSAPVNATDAVNRSYLDSAIANATSSISTLWGGSVGGNVWSLNSGNVGIGTTNPGVKLSVISSGSEITSSFYGDGAGYARITTDTVLGEDSQVSFMNGGSTKWSIGNDGTDDSFHINNGAGAFSGSSELAITSSGNVGIGTTNPGTSKLNIAGDTYISNDLTVNGNVRANILSTNRNVFGLERNILFNALARYTVSQSGPASVNLYYLFDGEYDPTYSAAGPSVGNPQIILIEGLPYLHTQAGAWVGWTTRYWPVTKFKIEGYDEYAGYNNWRTIADYSSTPYSGSDFMVKIPVGGSYTKLRYTVYEASGIDGKFGFSELFFIHPEATRPYTGFLPSSMYEGINGKVGIGTTAPGTRLSVVGDGTYSIDAGNNRIGNVSAPVNATDAVNKSYVDSAAGGGIGSGISGQTLRHDGSTWVANSNLFNNGTNVGIGTTAPTSPLTVSGNSTGIIGRFSQLGAWTGSNYALYVDDGDYTYLSGFRIETPGGLRSLFAPGGQAIGFATAGDSAITFTQSTSVERMRIAAGGNVGIGTTAPSQKLEVAGNSIDAWPTIIVSGGRSDAFAATGLTVKSPTGNLTSGLYSYNNQSSGRGFYGQPTITEFSQLETVNGPMGIGTRGAYGLYLGTNSSNVMTLTSGSNVGIGTTNPATRLSVVGDGTYSIDAGNNRIGNVSAPVNATDAVNRSYLDSAIANATSSISTLWGGSVGGNVWSLNSGNVGIGTTNPGYKLDVKGTSSTDIINTDIGLNLNPVANPSSGSISLINTPGNVNAGTHYYLVTYITDIGETNSYSLGSVTTDASNGQVSVNLPISSDYRVTGRKIYRTKVGAPSYSDYYLATISDNVTTTYTDNISDSSLTGIQSAGYYQVNTTNKNILLGNSKIMVVDRRATYFGMNAGANVNGGGDNSFFGYGAGVNATSANQNSAFGTRAGGGITTGGSNVFMGQSAGAAMSTGSSNIFIGRNAGISLNGGSSNNTIIGAFSFNLATQGGANYNTTLGYGTGSRNMGSNNIFLGYSAGSYETGSNKLIIDSVDRTSENDGRNSALIYGVSNLTPANQILSLGGGGNVGIGTTNPGTRLSVVGDGTYSIDAGNNRIGNLSAPVNATDAVNRSYLDSAIANATSSISTLWGGSVGGNVWSLNSGNVGIGTTDPGSYKLNIQGNSLINASGSSVNGILSIQSTDTSARGTLIRRGYYQYDSQDSSGSFYQSWGMRLNGSDNLWYRTYTGANNYLPYTQLSTIGTIVFGGTASNLVTNANPTLNPSMTINVGTGNIGIGTSAPSSRLVVQSPTQASAGDFSVDTTNGASSVTVGRLSSVSSDSTIFSVRNRDGIEYLRIDPVSTGDIKFASGASSDGTMIIKNAGNVGIGTTNPVNGKLEIKQTLDTVSSGLAIQGISGGNTLRLWLNGNTRNINAGSVNMLAFNTANIWFPTGNVGIGTTNPGTKLSVVGDGTYSIDAGNNRIGNIAAPVNATDAVNRSYLDSAIANATSSISTLWGGSVSGNVWSLNSGNVGVGTTNPSNKLEVDTGDQNALIPGLVLKGRTYDETGNYGPMLGFQTERTASNIVKAGIAFVRDSGYGTGNMHFLVDSVVDANQVALSDSKMTIMQNGNVGIGTTSPAATLEVKYVSGSGDIFKITNSSGNTAFSMDNSQLQAKFWGTQAAYPGVTSINNSNTGLFWPAPYNLLGFSVGGSEKMRIDSNGNVGIGATNPYYKLEVASGNIRTTGVGTSIRAGGGNAYIDIKEGYPGTINTFYGLGINVNDSNTRALTIDISGNVGIGITNPGTRLSVVGDGTYSIDAGNNRIGNIAAPVNATDAVNRSYLDSAIANATSSISTLWGGSVGGNVWSLNSGNVGIGTTNPGAKFTISNSGIGLVGTAMSAVLSSNAGSLGSTAGNELTLGSIGFTTGNTVSLGVRGYRTANGSDWTTTAIGLGMDVDNTARAGGSVWFNSNGNVGIGTASPSQKLDIQGNPANGSFVGTQILETALNKGLLIGVYKAPAATYDLSGLWPTGVTPGNTNYIFGTTGATSDTYFNASSGKNMYFQIAGANKMIIKNDGNVGIGTTNPGTRLSVVGDGTYSIDAGNNRIGNVSAPVNAADAVNKSYVDSAAGGGIGSGISGQTLRHDGSSWVANSNLFNNGTNVGIGTTNPVSTLDVFGSLRLSYDVLNYVNINTDSSGSVYFKPSNSTTYFNGPGNNRFYAYDYSSFPYPYLELSAHSLQLNKGGNTNYGTVSISDTGNSYINTSGNIGIGTTNPLGKLQVNGQIFVPSGLLNNQVRPAVGTTRIPGEIAGIGGAGSATPALSADDGFLRLSAGGGTSASTKSFIDISGFSTINDMKQNIIFGTNGAERLRIANGGNVGIGTTNPTHKLHIKNNAYQILAIERETAANANIAFINPNYTRYFGMNPTGGFGVGDSPDLSLAYFLIGNSGNVGIGITNPGTRLSVVGDGTYSIDAGNNRIGNIAAPVNATDAVNRSYLDSAIANATSSISTLWGGSVGGNVWSLNSGNVGIGTTDPGAYKLKVVGNVAVTGTFQTQTGSDFAEEFSVSSNLEPGTVVIMDNNGYKSVKSSLSAYDNTVVGIVSDNPSIIAGKVNSEKKVVVAMVGVVSVRVSNVNGDIKKGDLLTTSNISGYAMKSTVFKPGTVIGKALEDLKVKKGVIKVLVNLQ